MSYLIFGLALTGVNVRKDWCLVGAVCHLHPNIEKKRKKTAIFLDLDNQNQLYK